MYPTSAIGPPKPMHPSFRKYRANWARDAACNSCVCETVVISGMRHRFIDGDARCRSAVLFLLRRIDAMGVHVHRQAVDFPGDGHIAEFAEMCRIVLLKHGNKSVIAG